MSSMTWRSLAREVGVEFSPTLTWRQLEPALQLSEDGSTRPWAVWEGELEPAAADALFATLGRAADPPFFASFICRSSRSRMDCVHRLRSDLNVCGVL